MINPKDFADWVKSHTQMFGMSADDSVMVVSWRTALASFDLAELKVASIELLTSAPVYRNEHVSGLFRILGKNRARQTKAFTEQRDDEYEGLRCTNCQSLGFCIVPHPVCIKGGDFVVGPFGYKATTAITCSCVKGRRKSDSYEKYDRQKRPLTLASYESTVTAHWREMMQEKNEEERQRTTLKKTATFADNEKGPLKKKT